MLTRPTQSNISTDSKGATLVFWQKCIPAAICCQFVISNIYLKFLEDNKPGNILDKKQTHFLKVNLIHKIELLTSVMLLSIFMYIFFKYILLLKQCFHLVDVGMFE